MALSPMMTQYLNLKEKYPDCMILFRLGDFYEMFFEDAKKASKILDLTLTGRDCGLDERAPMCGVPYHAVDSYIVKLVENGIKVAICEQLTEPGGKELVKRDVVRIITAGTVIEDDMLDEKRNNYIASVYYNGNNKFGVAWSDVSTGEFNTVLVDENNPWNALVNRLITINPAEIISNDKLNDLYTFNESAYLPKVNKYYEWAYETNECEKIISSQLEVKDLKGFDFSADECVVSAAGALLNYFKETQKRALNHINKINYIYNSSYMTLDFITRNNLEIFETLKSRRKKGSLVWLLDKTDTPMGGRLLRQWIEQPLYSVEEINKRLDAVESFIKSADLRNYLDSLLNGIGDIDRLLGKLSYKTINPKDMLLLGESISSFPAIKLSLSGIDNSLINEIFNEISDLTELTSLIKSALKIDPAITLKEGGVIKEGYDKELDEYLGIHKNAAAILIQFENREKELTGIKNLKTGFNRVFGYYIEVPKSFADKVPYTYIRRQTVANSERYITEELKILEDKFLNAKENSIRTEQRLYAELLEKASTYIKSIQKSSQGIARLDCLLNFAKISVKNNYSKPIVTDKSTSILIKNGRHPVVEELLPASFISNDTEMNCEDARTIIITGPNMSGKSTYMRQVAVITLMAHFGCYVPADKAQISLTDRIFTRVGASDDVSFGQSTFMVEMKEVANILNNATSKSLVLLDEIGRGTSTYDGLSIAWAVTEYINNQIKCKTLLSTHYLELTEIKDLFEGIVNYKVTVKEYNGTIIFLRKITKGSANRSFGVEVAGISGVPKFITKRAKEILNKLEKKEINIKKSENNYFVDNNCEKSFENDKLFKVISKIKEIDTNNLTPMQALELLDNLKQEVENSCQG